MDFGEDDEYLEDDEMLDPATLPQVPKHLPNVLITGTPGTGKTTTAEQVAEQLGYTHINVGDLVREKSLHEGRDEVFDAFILDEDAVVDELEERMVQGGVVLDFHTTDFFPERWIQLVIVLRTQNDILHERLTARNYSLKKIEENLSAEILQVVLDEARDSYDERIVWELDSETVAQQERNVERVVEWVRARQTGEAEEELFEDPEE